MSTVIVGTTAVERAYFYDHNGAPADPDTIVAVVKKPDGTGGFTVTSSGITITQIGTGVYDVAVDTGPASAAGIWYLEVTGTGTIANKVLESRICVVRSSVA